TAVSQSCSVNVERIRRSKGLLVRSPVRRFSLELQYGFLAIMNQPRSTWIRELTRERIAHASCCRNPPPVSEPRSRRSGHGGLSGLAVGLGLGTDGIGRTLDRVHGRPCHQVSPSAAGCQGGLV